MTVKSLATGVAAITAIGAAAAGVTSIAPSTPAPLQVQSAVFSVPSPASGWYPQPLNPAADLPTPDQLISVLYALADPGVPFAGKANLVEGGVGPAEAKVADRELQKAAEQGELPLSFNVSDIVPAGPDAATASVNVTGPKLAGITQVITFVDQGGWKLSRSSALGLLQAAAAS